MQYQHAVVMTALAVLFLSGCGSNQASINQHKIDYQTDIHKAVDTVPVQPSEPTIPLDGRLRDEHLQMYVSVKIKQEQLRYEAEDAIEATYIAGNRAVVIPAAASKQSLSAASPAAKKASARYEQQAIENFEFNTHLYFWAKHTIHETFTRASREGTLKRRASNFKEYVLSHNLQMVEKYKDQLRFAENYKLNPPQSIVQHAAKIGPDVADQPKALFLLPSS